MPQAAIRTRTSRGPTAGSDTPASINGLPNAVRRIARIVSTMLPEHVAEEVSLLPARTFRCVGDAQSEQIVRRRDLRAGIQVHRLRHVVRSEEHTSELQSH